MRQRAKYVLLILFVIQLHPFAFAENPAGPATGLSNALQQIQQLGPQGSGHREAIVAWQQIASRPASDLPAILSGMSDDNPLADNWIRAAVDAISERVLQANQAYPVAELEAYLEDRSHAPRSRRLAYEWIVRADPAAKSRIIPSLIDDPSLELRREAVSALLTRADQAKTDGKQGAAIAMYRSSLEAARDVDQIDTATKQLRELGETVDLPEHFGFIMNWHLIAPFDNTNQAGFDQAYPPEKTIDLAGSYEGKEGTVTWIEHTTEDEFGKVDLNTALEKHKGAIAYAVATFESEDARPADLRLGCINANKIWLNGQELTANDVYHAGRGIDQYVGTGQLKAGKNTILLKICQNEQTESWAQDWEFQLRVCDHLGTAILAADR
ncbi:MAG: hypothetical protein GY768_15040 [Planctomycetaceae bacterium]|nr:hypothetical protein [Planctomycetaceae bacterium]